MSRLRPLRLVLLALLSVFCTSPFANASGTASSEYARTQQRLARGWNTWDTHNVLAHVLLPYGLSVSVGFNRGELSGDSYLHSAVFGQEEPKITPGPHACDGSYTELILDFRGLKLRLQSATEREDLMLLVTPLTQEMPPRASVVFQAGMLWNRPGQLEHTGNAIAVRLPGRPAFSINITGSVEHNSAVSSPGPYLSTPLTQAVGLSTGRVRTLPEIEAVVERARQNYRRRMESYGDSVELADAIETVLGWDTIYEPERGRVLSPVSRSWSQRFGGYVLFCWDNFFAAYMAGLRHGDLAYANAMEMLNSITPAGFIPNFARARGWNSYDRSEPPVGSVVALALYEKYHDRWFLQDAFEPLLRWNRWWTANREVQGYLAWGSTPNGALWEASDRAISTAQGARFESGLDNSPMYDDVPFDFTSHVMQFADVGLLSLYIADCNALAAIADTLGRNAEAVEIRNRAKQYTSALNRLWMSRAGSF